MVFKGLVIRFPIRKCSKRIKRGPWKSGVGSQQCNKKLCSPIERQAELLGVVADLHGHAAINVVQSLHLLLGKLEVQLQILGDALLVHTLGQGDIALLQRPLHKNLSRGHVQSLRSLLHGRQGHVRLAGTQSGVAHYDDALGEAPLGHLLVVVGGVDFQLVHGRRDLTVVQAVCQQQVGPVRDADGLGLALLHQAFHLLPHHVSGDLGPLLSAQRVQASRLVDADRHVNEVEVQVVQLHVLQGLVTGSLDLVPVVGPELAHDEELLSLHLPGLQDLGQGLADVSLVAVNGSTVQAAVSCVDGSLQGLRALGRRGLPEAEGDVGHLETAIQLHGHGCEDDSIELLSSVAERI
mmetsp:Transcript_93852/g.195780  ORF Transcript_93852/g.195780 Transcript_93852/m.195780 type:complete len:351 (-) Transcript_93852:80-1132(-)